MQTARPSLALQSAMGLSLFLSAAIFGFFYAWICSTMWGLDQIDPRTAITAMNAMNKSVRNGVFMPAFFGTPVTLLLTGGLAWWEGHRSVAAWLVAAAVLYLGGALALTASVNVPMNRAMIAAGTPGSLEEAQAIWSAYSPRWQMFNQIRTGVSALVFGMALVALVRLVRRD